MKISNSGALEARLMPMLCYITQYLVSVVHMPLQLDRISCECGWEYNEYSAFLGQSCGRWKSTTLRLDEMLTSHLQHACR